MYQAYLYALDVKTGDERFVFREFRFGSYGTPCIHEHRAFFSALDGYLYCIDLHTGKELWKINLESRAFASPTLIKRLQRKVSVCVGQIMEDSMSLTLRQVAQ